VILASMVTAIGTWLFLDEAHWSVIRGRLQTSTEQQRLWSANKGLEQDNSILRERVIALERIASLDKQTETFLQKEIRGLQDEVFRLKGELAFYQGIMESADQTKGLDVHSIYVRPLAQANTYQLKLVLTHVANDEAEAAGVMSITVEGLQNGVLRLLSLDEVSADAAPVMAYKFRNFKRFDASMQLPGGFVPQRVIVELQLNDKKPSKIKKVFDWPVTAN
jgi:hypothetical protein